MGCGHEPHRYATLADMQEFGFGQLYLDDQEAKEVLGEKWTDWQPKSGQSWHSFNDYIKYGDSEAWENGGAKIGFAPTLAITMRRDTTTSPCL